MKRLTYLSIAEIELARPQNFMMKDNQVWEDCFSTPFGRLANVFVRNRSGGLYLNRPFAAVESFRIRIGCFTGNCRIASRLFPCFTSVAVLKAGGIV